MYPHWIFNISTMQNKFLLFWFLTNGIRRRQSSIGRWGRNGQKSSWSLLKLNLQSKGELHVNHTFNILIFCAKYLVFSFLNCPIGMESPLQTGGQNKHISSCQKIKFC